MTDKEYEIKKKAIMDEHGMDEEEFVTVLGHIERGFAEFGVAHTREQSLLRVEDILQPDFKGFSDMLTAKFEGK